MKTYGKVFLKDGLLWYHTLQFGQRSLYRLMKWIQWSFWKIGFYWHDYFFDECTPTGNCRCRHKICK